MSSRPKGLRARPYIGNLIGCRDGSTIAHTDDGKISLAVFVDQM
jgi:hypothetical protein